MVTGKYRFVEHLEKLREDRGALAALRRGLGQAPGTVASMYRYVVPWLYGDISRRDEAAHYLVASLFAYHPLEGGDGNVGTHFAEARNKEKGDTTAIERRFTALLAAHPDDLDTYLRQAVGYLRSKEVPIDWHQLFGDARRWHFDDRRVQQAWARAFWAPRDQAHAVSNNEGEE